MLIAAFSRLRARLNGNHQMNYSQQLFISFSPVLISDLYRKFGKQIQRRQLDLPEYAASFLNYKALKKVSFYALPCAQQKIQHPYSSLMVPTTAHQTIKCNTNYPGPECCGCCPRWSRSADCPTCKQGGVLLSPGMDVPWLQYSAGMNHNSHSPPSTGT